MQVQLGAYDAYLLEVRSPADADLLLSQWHAEAATQALAWQILSPSDGPQQALDYALPTPLRMQYPALALWDGTQQLQFAAVYDYAEARGYPQVIPLLYPAAPTPLPLAYSAQHYYPL